MKKEILRYIVALRVSIEHRVEILITPLRNRLWVKLYGYTYDDRKLFEEIVKNQKKYDKQALAFNGASSSVIPKSHKIAIEVINQLKPLRKIIGIQPMNQPVTKMHWLRFKKHETGQMSIDIISDIAEAKSRKLAAKLPFEPTDASRKKLGIDIAQEVTSSLLDGLDAIAQKESIEVLGTPAEVANRIILRINMAANDIARDTRRGAGNVAILSPMIWDYIKAYVTESTAFTTHGENLSTDTSLDHVGTLNGMMQVFVDRRASTDTSVLVGYKGQSDIDCGCAFIPYILVMGSGHVDTGLSTMCRYDSKADDMSPLYFRKLSFKYYE